MNVLTGLKPTFARIARHLPAPFVSAHLLVMLEAARHMHWLVPPVALNGRRFGITLEDTGLHFRFMCREGRFCPITGGQDADLEITADIASFVSLASGTTDADTLFFQRRLKIAGDTDLGLIVKNWLDATERPAWLSRLGAMLERRP